MSSSTVLLQHTVFPFSSAFSGPGTIESIAKRVRWGRNKIFNFSQERSIKGEAEALPANDPSPDPDPSPNANDPLPGNEGESAGTTSYDANRYTPSVYSQDSHHDPPDLDDEPSDSTPQSPPSAYDGEDKPSSVEPEYSSKGHNSKDEFSTHEPEDAVRTHTADVQSPSPPQQPHPAGSPSRGASGITVTRQVTVTNDAAAEQPHSPNALSQSGETLASNRSPTS
ncbi:hypothetical protein BS50DRAFT_630717 [Corynespora cassiicola Philippines]|uniref:Uncharacterized protein n=1 Tax=Corynespora cassiicola Philippines TaxID=1448308 RepID=A0A2T2NYY3_CORCC|nr:hypothetical protein BS50DRAFT_630717 [Corynespora cassiicola Philippines]